MSEIDSSWFQANLWLFILMAIAIAVFLAITIVWGIRAHHRQLSAGREHLIGKTAEVKTVMNPKGIILIEGELWTAISEDGRAKPGDEVFVNKVEGLKLWVTKSKMVNK